MRRFGLLCATMLLAPAAQAQRERETLGVAAERDGGETAMADGIHFSGEARERVEMQDNSPLLPTATRGDVVGYHRLLAAADLRAGAVRAYLQAGTRLESGLNGPRVPISTDRFDIQQAFVDLTIGHKDRRLRIRGGRQETLFEFFAAQDSPNVRRSWDGVRGTLLFDGWEGDAFTLSRVQPALGVFDDSSQRSDRANGLHLISPPDAIGPFYLSAYYYDVRQTSVRLLAATAPARTHTAGAALDGAIGHFTLRASGGHQSGSFAGRSVDAYNYEAVIGLTLPDARWSPTVAVRTDGFSGGPPQARRLATWNPLFPNYGYSTEAALQSPSNLRKVGAVATIKPARTVELRYRGEGLWRFSRRDAFYPPSSFAPIPPHGENHRWLGLQQQIFLDWKASKQVTVSAAYVNFVAGRFFTDIGRTDQNFGMVAVEWRF